MRWCIARNGAVASPLVHDWRLIISAIVHRVTIHGTDQPRVVLGKLGCDAAIDQACRTADFTVPNHPAHRCPSDKKAHGYLPIAGRKRRIQKIEANSWAGHVLRDLSCQDWRLRSSREVSIIPLRCSSHDQEIVPLRAARLPVAVASFRRSP